MRPFVVAFAVLSVVGYPAARGHAHDCDQTVRTHLVSLYRDRAYLDVHHLATTLRVLCPDPNFNGDYGYLDALALIHLDDIDRGRDMLRSLARDTSVAMSWSYLRGNDGELSSAITRLPTEPRARFSALLSLDDPDAFHRHLAATTPAIRDQALPIFARYRASHERAPWLAGTLSAVVPGTGQVYAGSWGAGATSFAFNGLLIGSTIELARRDLWITAAASAALASMFYTGNILNAMDLARRRNDLSQRPHRIGLEELLLPEVYP